MNPPAAVLFDLGDTLLAEGPSDVAAGVARLATDGRFAPALEAAPADQLTAELAHAIHRVRATNAPDFTIRSWLSAKLPGASAADVAELELAFWCRMARLDPIPGVERALLELRDEGVLLAVVSNSVFSAEVIAFELERTRLLSFFRFVLSSADAGVRKPDPRLFQLALDRLEVTPRSAWFVGDSLDKDVRGATAAGMASLWLRGEPGAALPPAARAVADWRAFLGLFRAALGRQ